jgi:hypothetical protein
VSAEIIAFVPRPRGVRTDEMEVAKAATSLRRDSRSRQAVIDDLPNISAARVWASQYVARVGTYFQTGANGLFACGAERLKSFMVGVR